MAPESPQSQQLNNPTRDLQTNQLKNQQKKTSAYNQIVPSKELSTNTLPCYFHSKPNF